MWDTSVIFKQLPKVNNRPLGGNSPNLVTLPRNLIYLTGFDVPTLAKMLQPVKTITADLITIFPAQAHCHRIAPNRPTFSHCVCTTIFLSISTNGGM
jgi:hypothetical protein